ncbi:response regulator [Thalassotalea fusca]
MIDNRKVLVVDDKQHVLDTVRIWLAECGLVVDTASNGLDGLEKASKGNYRLIIIDHLMPLMNGLQLAKNLKQKELTANIPLLFMTTQDVKSINDSTDVKNFISIVEKPLDKTEFFTVLSRYLPENSLKQSL